MKLSIVIPVFNEIKTIEKIIRKVLQAPLPKGWDKEVVVVDDGSTDGTREVLKNYQRPYSLHILFRAENGGKGAAIKDGFKYATGDYILIQDADEEYSTEDYPALLQPLQNAKVESVFGSRVLGKNNVSFSRIYYYGGLLLTKIFNRCFKSSLTDLATCYKVFSKSHREEIIKLPANDFVFDVVELSYYLVKKTKVVEVPIRYTARTETEGKKLNWRHGLSSLKEILRLWLIERNMIGFVKNTIEKVKNFLELKPYIKTLLTFSFFLSIFTWMYFSVAPLSSGDDHFFHIRFAELMREKGFFASFWNFKSLYFSYMTENKYFVYYNFLFYLALIPFTFIKPLFLAIKLYAVIAAALAFTGIYEFVRRLKITNAFLWTIAAFSLLGSFSLWRMFLSRAYVLAPLFLLALLYCLYKKKYVWVFCISFLYLFWHSLTFFFPLGVAIIYYGFEQFYGEKGDKKNVLYTFLGVIFAIIFVYFISPGFLIYVKDVVFGIYWETIIGKKVSIGEGAELYPSPIFDYISGNIITFMVLLITLCVEIYRYGAYRAGKISQEVVEYTAAIRSTLFFMTIGLFVGIILVSTRFSDYFIFFASVYLILALNSIIHEISFKDLSLKKPLFVGICLSIVYLFTNNIIAIQNSIAYYGAPPEQFERVGTWLKENTKKGDIVFNPTWNWFPQLYYYSPNNNYIAGLEPRFMYVTNPQLYWLWQNISYKGYICDLERCPQLEVIQSIELQHNPMQWHQTQGDEIAATILNIFHSRYIISSPEFTYLN
ncbi:MAG: glycosyltransferase, partial [Nitrosopumilus sp.]|nr:glycosyltransferase [Nitrosopumilus sp.]